MNEQKNNIKKILKKILPQVILLVILFLLCYFSTFAIYFANERENNRATRPDGTIYYPMDFTLSLTEKISYHFGEAIGVVLTLFLIYLYFIGTSKFYKKYIEEWGINKIIYYLFTIWVFIVVVYYFATSQLGKSFF